MIQSKKVKVMIIIVFVVLIGILLFLLIDREKKQKESDYTPVTNASTFFTVASCANRYITYLSNKQADNLALVLNKKYDVDDAISEFNNLDDTPYTISVRKVYQADMDKRNVKYYVYGLLRKDILDEFDYGTPYYLIVDINTEKQTFTVTPYDGKVFE